jgi:hypothetical protein
MGGWGTYGTRDRALLATLAAALATVTLGATQVAARECHATCQESRSTCVVAAKVEKRGCKQQCRDAADPSACRRDCRQGFAASKTGCKGTIVTCREECEQPCDDPGDEECVDSCVHDLRDCAADVRDAGKSCARACVAASAAVAEHGGHGGDHGDDGDDDGGHHGGGFGGDDCWRAPDPLQCWLDKLGGVGKCLQACASSIEVGLDDCTTAASGCRDACTKPPGSASRAFLAKPSDLLE